MVLVLHFVQKPAHKQANDTAPGKRPLPVPVPEPPLSSVTALASVCVCVHYTLSLCGCFMDVALISTRGSPRTSGVGRAQLTEATAFPVSP